MRELSSREKKLAAAAAVVVAAGVIVSLWSPEASPSRRGSPSLSELEALARRVKASEKTMAKYRRLSRFYGDPPMPASPGDVGNRLTRLLYRAAEGKARLQRISQTGTQKIRGYKEYDKVVVRADFTCSDLERLLKFIGELKASPQVLAIEEIVVKPPRKKPMTGTVTVSAFTKKKKVKKRKS